MKIGAKSKLRNILVSMKISQFFWGLVHYIFLNGPKSSLYIYIYTPTVFWRV